MVGELNDFTKKHDYLICVDSDGCAVDTMEVKHKQCFGPCMVAEWGLEPWRDIILSRWNEINLYSVTRGINRFKGLSMALEEVDRTYRHIDGISELSDWVERTKELSNRSLEDELTRNNATILRKALHWSVAVNEAISQLPWSVKRAFEGVKAGFESVRSFADISVVSSANRDAVEEEWKRLGLLESVDLVLCQDAGTKIHCIADLKKKGYGEKNVLMVGDAPGDRVAAELNGVFFYPILVRHEAESWHEFPNAARLMRDGEYEEYGQRKGIEFLANLSTEES